MSDYRLHEANIEVPDDWRDTSINAFSLVSESGESTANLTITRDSGAESKDVQAYADQQLVAAAKKLKRYRLLERRPAEISGRPAIEADYVWTTPERIEIQQRQLYVMRGKVAVIFTLTSKSQDFPAYESTWTRFVSSIRLRDL